MSSLTWSRAALHTGLGFRVEGLGFEVQGLGFGVKQGLPAHVVPICYDLYAMIGTMIGQAGPPCARRAEHFSCKPP